ncbi:MAG: RHS repeat-associated core domain-containing protein, partial [Acutalibacteraceae bacterium]
IDGFRVKNDLAVKTYTYGNSSWRDQLTSFDGQSISYDEIGNPTSYLGAALTWERGRTLSSYTKDGLAVSYSYNYDGQRISKTVNGVTTQFIYNGGTLAGQKTGDNVISWISGADGEYIGFTYNQAEYYYIRNLQNDIIGIADSSGNIVVTYEYDVWGKVVNISDTTLNGIGSINPIRYRGYYYDSETGLYYLVSRYYNPEVGRFLNTDSYVSTGEDIIGFNPFAYCLNNPVNKIDEDGCDPVPIWAKHIISGTATESEYAKALSVNPNNWAGSAGYTVRRAVSLAKEHQSNIIVAEHHKKGTTNKANRQKHENGQARKQRDNYGEKGDARRRPNPNKRRYDFELDIGVGERILCGTIAIGALSYVAYLVVNDVTVVGIIDDAQIVPLLPIIWDNVVKAFS